MIMKKPIFIGIDPGTTTGYAVLDLDGKLIKTGSSKQVGLNSLIDIIFEVGLPVACGTDKAKVPDLIEKFSIKTGCKKIKPDNDLKVGEKRELAKGKKFKNSHEMDAIASAYLTYNKFASKIRKIRRYCKKAGKDSIIENIIIYSLREGLTLENAIRLIEGNDQDTKTVRQIIEKDPPSSCRLLYSL
jgi:hypothetical protein